MTKIIFTILAALFIYAPFMRAQPPQLSQPVAFVGTTPTGTCTPGVPLQYNLNSGTLSGCSGGTPVWGPIPVTFLAGLTSALPSTCSVGGIYFATDQPAGLNLFVCGTTNVWTRSSYQQGLNASKPATCTVGQLWFSTDVTPGSNVYGCTATNVWTLETGGGGSSTAVAITSGLTSALPGTCSPGGSPNVYFATDQPSGLNLFECTATNTWTRAAYVQGLTVALPATCSVGQMYFATDATPGENWFYCTAANTWTPQVIGGSGGSSTPYCAISTGSKSGCSVTSFSSGMTISAATHGEGTFAFAVGWDNATPQNQVALDVTRDGAGDLTITYVTAPYEIDVYSLSSVGGLYCVISSGSKTPCSSTTFSSGMTITEATHGRGTFVFALCWDNSTPQVQLACDVARASNGDMTITYLTAPYEIDFFGGTAGGGSGGGTVNAPGAPFQLTYYPSSSATVSGVSINGVVSVHTTAGVAPSQSTANELSSPVQCQATTGSPTTYACNLTPSPVSYAVGATYSFMADVANSGATTINFNSIGAVVIKKVQGGITTDLAANDLRSGQWVKLTYDGTNMQMASQLGNLNSLSQRSFAYTNSPQSIPNTTNTAMQFTVNLYDTGIHSTSVNNTRFVAPVTGLYLCAGTATFSGSPTGLREIFIEVDGSVTNTYSLQTVASTGSGSTTSVSVSAVLQLNASDYVEFYVWQGSGSALSIQGTGQSASNGSIVQIQ